MEITEVTRRDILEFLLSRRIHFSGRLELIPFLKKVWDLSTMPSTDSRFKDAEGDIWQHMINNYDWDSKYLLYEYLDLLQRPDNEFIKFLETTLHPIVLSDNEIIELTLTEFNMKLSADGFVVEQTGEISGRPIYSIVRMDKKAESN